MDYRINVSLWTNVFAVPGEIVDEHIKLCGGAALKALLFLLRRGGETNAEEIAAFFGMPMPDALDAINYWIRRGIIIKTTEPPGKPAADSCAAPPDATPPDAAPPDAAPACGEDTGTENAVCEKKKSPESVEKPGMVRNRLTTRQVNEMSRADKNIENLLQEAQAVLGKPLTPVATDTVTALYAYYGMQPDLILMLLQYCVSLGKDNMRYIEKVAASWLEKGIDTHEKADREILRAAQQINSEGKIRRLFGIHDRALTSGETEYIRKWTEDFGFSADIIGLAYERAVEVKGRLSFAYIGGILQNWHSKGITSKAQALEETVKGKSEKKTASAAGASYDIQELERLVAYGEV